MTRWFGKLIRDELRSLGSVGFFLVLALTIGSATSWFEGGAARYTANHTVEAASVDQIGYISQEATSTTEAFLPPGVSTTTQP